MRLRAAPGGLLDSGRFSLEIAAGRRGTPPRTERVGAEPSEAPPVRLMARAGD
jgi:hypothetical protein